MKSVIGSVVSLRSRAMYACINQRASWNAPVIVTSEALSEMIFWKENIKDMNYCLMENVSCDSIDFSGCGSSNICTVFSDASGLGYGGYVEGASGSDVIGSWSENETGLSSTWRELEAVHRVLLSNIESLEGQQITWKTDDNFE
jgi:hypothetical protein